MCELYWNVEREMSLNYWPWYGIPCDLRVTTSSPPEALLQPRAESPREILSLLGNWDRSLYCVTLCHHSLIDSLSFFPDSGTRVFPAVPSISCPFLPGPLLGPALWALYSLLYGHSTSSLALWPCLPGSLMFSLYHTLPYIPCLQDSQHPGDSTHPMSASAGMEASGEQLAYAADWVCENLLLCAS